MKKYFLFLLVAVFMGCPPIESTINSDESQTQAVDFSVLTKEFNGGSWNAYVDVNGNITSVTAPTDPIVIALEESKTSLSLKMPAFTSETMPSIPAITYTGIQVAQNGAALDLSRTDYEFTITVEEAPAVQAREGEATTQTTTVEKTIKLSKFKGTFENGKLSIEMNFIYGKMPFPFVCHYTECTLEDIVSEKGYNFGSHTLAFLTATAGTNPRQPAFSGNYSMKMGSVNQTGTYTAAKADNKANLYNCVFTATAEGNATPHAMNWQIEIRSAAEFILYAVTEKMVYSTKATEATGGAAVEGSTYTMQSITNSTGYSFTTSSGASHTLSILESTAGDEGVFTGKASYGFAQFKTEGEYSAKPISGSDPVAYECVFFGSTYYKVEIISGTSIKLYSGTKTYERKADAKGTLAQRN